MQHPGAPVASSMSPTWTTEWWAQVEAHALYFRMGFHRAPELDWSPASGVDLIGFRLSL